VATGLDTDKANAAIKEGYTAIERFGSRRVRNWTIAVVAILAFSLWAVWRDGWDLYFQRIVDALNNGFIYAAMALSLVLIYKATGVINFAQGNMAMFGTYIAWVLVYDHSFPIWLGIIGAMLISAVGGAAIERVFIRPFDPSNHLAIIIVTLAWFIILGGLATVIWGADPYAFDTPFPRNSHFDLLGARFFYSGLGTWFTVMAVLVLVSLLLRKTKVGLAFRALSSNLESSRLVGIHTGRTIQFGWALAAAVGTLAGTLIAYKTFLTPTFMGTVLIYSFAAAALGGLDSLPGAVVGGLLIGLAETMIGGYIDPIGSDLALGGALVVIIVVLYVRPTGLFGSKRPERV